MQKRYYKIGEVANLLGVNPSRIRYWEKEFPQLRPKRRHNNRRIYTAEELRLLQLIHYLVEERKLTLQGVRKILNSETLKKRMEEEQAIVSRLMKIRAFLVQLKEKL